MAYRSHKRALECRREELEAELFAIEDDLAHHEQLSHRAERLHKELRELVQQLEPLPPRPGRYGYVLGALGSTGLLMLLSLGAYWLTRPNWVTSHQRSAAAMARNVRTAAIQYRALHPAGDCPSLKALVDAKEVSTGSVRDPWGVSFRIRCSGDDVIVTSAGLDGHFGNADDIVLAQPPPSADSAQP